MHHAVAAKDLSIVRLLEDFGADATIKNEEGITPIDMAITENIRDIKLYFMS